MKISSRVRRLNIYFILIPLIITLNLFLSSLPLTNTLGYELATINAIVLFIFGGLIVIKCAKNEAHLSFQLLLAKNLKSLLLMITIPLFISSLSSLMVAKCPIVDGFYFYLVITVPAFVFGMISAYFSFVLSKKYSLLFFLLFFFLILLSTAHEFFVNPQIYFFNAIFGFFPGTIYDEDLAVDRLLIAYRLFNLAFFIVILSLSEYLLQNKYTKKIVVILLLLAIVVGFSLLKPLLYFATDRNRLESNLDNTVSTESFTIHLPDSATIREAKFAALLHEYYLDQIKNYLDIRTNHRIDSYLYKEREQKRILLGAGSANIAKPWLNQIYLNLSRFEESLKHELVHVIASEFGTTPLMVADNFSPSLIEGLAMAVENNYDGYPVHYMAKLAFQAGYKIRIESLFSGLNFFTSTSSISYIYSGSFIKFLSDRYGLKKMKLLYSDTNFLKIYGKTLSTLAAEYTGYLENYTIDYNNNKAQLYFGGMTIFKKFCPRVAASEVKKGWTLFNNNKITEAFKLFQKVFDYSNSYPSLNGLIASYSKQKKYLEAKKYLSQQLPNFKGSPYYYYLELVYADLHIECDEKEEAVEIYDSLLTQKPHIQYTNQVLLRKAILNESIDSLKVYFSKNRTQKYQTLFRMNEDVLQYFSIPSLLQYSEIANLDSDTLIELLKVRFKVTDPISSYAALELSRYALKKFKYESAQYFAVLALNVKRDEETNHPYVENLKMVNWFKNNADEIKLKFNFRP